MSTASTSHKKQDGTLAVSKDRRSVSWTPTAPPGAPPSVTVKVSEITNLQQTPANSSKVSIKVVVQRRGEDAPENFVFNFISPQSARAEQAALTDSIRHAIEAAKAEDKRQPPAVPTDGPGQSEAMAIAKAVSAGARSDEGWYDDSRLVSDVQLQRSLLGFNPQLRQRFEEALRDKPDSISISQFSTQFWYVRVHLLRAYAVERSQSHGTYNVLSEVKPRNVDGTTRLNLSKEQIQLIFKQHPLVKRVYDENVPALSEMEFWSRFFVSRLFKKLKGEKIVEIDSTDPKLDKYLNADENAEQGRPLPLAHVPHFIDLEGNEQNHSQRQGNQPDWTMRPTAQDKVPILRVLNNMSEKMMVDVAPADGEAHGPVGMDEETFNGLQLLDLQRNDRDNRVKLNIREQKRFFVGARDGQLSEESRMYLKQNPANVLSELKGDLGTRHLGGPAGRGVQLETAIGVGYDSDSDSDEEGSGHKAEKDSRIGSSASRHAATAQILDAIRQQKLQPDSATASSDVLATADAASSGLSDTLVASLVMTHNTTIEFLHYFWTVYLSGDADRANELQKLVETLDKSLDRIKAVADTAEKERSERIQRARKQIEEYQQRTGKRRRFDPASIKGGSKAVNKVMEPAVRAISAATAQYRSALEAQMQ